jgi:hypothetical protein
MRRLPLLLTVLAAAPGSAIIDPNPTEVGYREKGVRYLFDARIQRTKRYLGPEKKSEVSGPCPRIKKLHLVVRIWHSIFLT